VRLEPWCVCYLFYRYCCSSVERQYEWCHKHLLVVKVGGRGIVGRCMSIDVVGCRNFLLMKISPWSLVSSFVVRHAGPAVIFAVAFGVGFGFVLAIVAEVEEAPTLAFAIAVYVAVV
jgi:hypothetical protein